MTRPVGPKPGRAAFRRLAETLAAVGAPHLVLSAGAARYRDPIRYRVASPADVRANPDHWLRPRAERRRLEAEAGRAARRRARKRSHTNAGGDPR